MMNNSITHTFRVCMRASKPLLEDPHTSNQEGGGLRSSNFTPLDLMFGLGRVVERGNLLLRIVRDESDHHGQLLPLVETDRPSGSSDLYGFVQGG